MRNFTLLVALLCVSVSMQAQQLISAPLPSPKASVAQTIGMTDVKVTYFRPAVKGREIWGKIVPDNAVWRAGANDNTVIHFSTDVTVEGSELKAGTYGFHILPQGEAAILIFSNNSTSWGSFSYNESEDALRVTITPKKAAKFYEYLTFEFENPTAESAVCALNWENKSFPFTIKANTSEFVVAKIRNDLRNRAGWTWQGWNEAATYCLNNNTNTEEALGWAAQSVNINPNGMNMITKARLTAKAKSVSADKEQEVILASLDNDLATLPVTWKEYEAAATYALQHKNYDKALAWAEKSISTSTSLNNMLVKAQVYEAKGDTKTAAKIKTEAIAKGSNAELNAYGYQLLFAGNMDEAVAVFKTNTEKNPTDPNVWDSYGEGLYIAGQKDKAKEAFQKSLSLNPPDNVRANSMKFLTMMEVKVP